MPRTTLLSFVLVLAGSLPNVHGQTEIGWKFKQGERFYLEETAKVKIHVQIAGDEMKEEIHSTLLSRFTVLKVNLDGSVVLEQKVESIKLSNANGPVQGNAFLNAMQGASFTFTFSPRMEVTEFEGYERLVQKLAEVDPDAARQFRTEMSKAETQQRLSEPFVLYLSHRAVKAGDRWTHKRDTNLGPMGSATMNLTFTHGGTQFHKGKLVENLVLTGTATHRLPKAAPGTEIAITKGNIKFEGIKGKVFFDATAGRLVQFDFQANMNGTVTFAGPGTEMDGRMSGEMTQTLRVLDRQPE